MSQHISMRSLDKWCSLRSATLFLAASGATINFYATYKLLTTWFSVRWAWSNNEESEWEGLSWKIDSAKALGALVCAYFFVGGIASVVGVVGVIKRRTSNVRLFRDYCIADLAFGFASTAILAYFTKKSFLRNMICEELTRQPDLLGSLSDSAGLNVENCESFLKKAFVALVICLGVVMFIRLQFALTVLNYYTHLRRTEQRIENVELLSRRHRSRSRSRSHSRSSSQKILLLSQTLSAVGGNIKDDGEQTALVYAPVRLSLEQAKGMKVHEAYLTLSGSHSDRGEGRISLPILEGEGLNDKSY